jgi:hypothetical protein
LKGGLGHELLSPGAVLRQRIPVGEGRREVEVGQVAFKRVKRERGLCSMSVCLFVFVVIRK